MINTLSIEYGQRMDKRMKDFIKSSNGTCCNKVDLLDLDFEDMHRKTNSILESMNSDLRNEFVLLNANSNKTLINFEKSLDK